MEAAVKTGVVRQNEFKRISIEPRLRKVSKPKQILFFINRVGSLLLNFSRKRLLDKVFTELKNRPLNFLRKPKSTIVKLSANPQKQGLHGNEYEA